jgi:hypothetical protein
MEIVEPSLSVIIRVTLIMKSWRSGKRIMINMIIVEMSILDGIVSHFYSVLSLKDSILVFNIDTNNQQWAGETRWKYFTITHPKNYRGGN